MVECGGGGEEGVGRERGEKEEEVEVRRAEVDRAKIRQGRRIEAQS